jgi:hypothetical protein
LAKFSERGATLMSRTVALKQLGGRLRDLLVSAGALERWAVPEVDVLQL